MTFLTPLAPSNLRVKNCPGIVSSLSQNTCSCGNSGHGILQARILQWVAVPFSRGSSQLRNWTQVSCIAGRFFTNWASREAHTYEHTTAKKVSEGLWEAQGVSVHVECDSSQKFNVTKEIKWVNSVHTSLKHKWKDTFNSFCNLWANSGSRGIENFVRKYQVVHDLVCSCVNGLYSLGIWFRRQIFRINLGCVSPYSKMNILAGPKLSQAAHGVPSPGTVV